METTTAAITPDTSVTVSKTQKMLDHLAKAKDGLRLSEIQRFLWEHDHDHEVEPFTTALRGYWCTALYGGPMYHSGLLNFYANKVNGRWVRNDQPHLGHPWRTMNAAGNMHSALR